MIRPTTADLTPELKSIQGKWLRAKREEQDLLYAREFGPAFVPLFSGLPLHGWAGDRPRFKALISVLGLSWQPLALMAAWAKPESILLIGTTDSLGNKVNGEPVLNVISRLSGVPIHCFIPHRIDDPEELAIYRAVRSFVQEHDLAPHEIAVDPTGGKKSMSASAALAGYLAGAWIVYVDYAEYTVERRIPVAGTEYPRLLQNPLQVFGEIEFDRVKNAYRRGNYEEAYHLAEILAARLYEPREAEALALLAKAYGAWHHFLFKQAADEMDRLAEHLDRFVQFGRWPWCRDIMYKVQVQRHVIRELSELTARVCEQEMPKTVEEAFPLVLNHLAAAERSLDNGHVGAAVLLVYATLERYVDLCLWVHYGLDDEDPDYAKLNLDIQAFHNTGGIMHGKRYERRDPTGKITLSLGSQLLATLRPELLPQDFLRKILGLMNDRNKCEFEHGLCPRALAVEKVARHIQTVKRLLQLQLEQLGRSLEEDLERYRFPAI